jgi:hypothetical protein
MGIVRLAADLPQELENELRRETSGETLKWAGRAAGGPEGVEGLVVIVAGVLIAMYNLPGVFAAIGMLIDLTELGRSPAGGYGAMGGALIAFFAGAALIALGLRFLATARRAVWAITDARMLRLIGGKDCCEWRSDDILDVRRLNWDDPRRRALAVTAREGRGDMGLVMTGKADLEAADRALAELKA